MARMQLQLEKQLRRKSPIADIVRTIRGRAEYCDHRVCLWLRVCVSLCASVRSYPFLIYLMFFQLFIYFSGSVR